MKRLFSMKMPVAVLLAISLLLGCSPAMAAGRLVYPIFKAFDSGANLLVGGKLYTYEPGTTTAKTTYSDAAETTPHANPIILDSLGEKEIFLDGATKLVLKDSTDVTIWTKNSVLPGDGFVVGDTATVDTIAALRLISGSAGSSAQPTGYYASGDGAGGPLRTWATGAPGTYTDNGGSIIVPTGGDGSGAWVGPDIWRWSVEEFGAKGDGTTDDGQEINLALANSKFVNFNHANYGTTVKIVVPSSAHIDGIGGGQYPAAAYITSANFIATPKSRIVALASFPGSTPVVEVKTADGALYTHQNVSINGLMIDCANIADYGLKVVSVKQSKFENILVFRPVLVGIIEDVLSGGAVTTEGNNATQFNDWKNVTVWAGNTGTTVGWQQTGTNLHNVNQSTYTNCGVVSNHGDALQVINADTNTWIGFRTYTFGKGVGVRLYGNSAGLSASFARNNVFLNPILAGSSHSGTAQSGGASTITLAAGASADDLQYEGRNILISSGTGVGQQRNISTYNGTTKVATVSEAWTTQPDATSGYSIYTGGVVAEDGTTVSSTDNVMYGYHTSNGASWPIVDSGVRFYYTLAGGGPSFGWTKFTPTVTFSTPGDLSVSYTTQSGRYWLENKTVKFVISLVFVPTYTTASGNFRVSGFQYLSLPATYGGFFHPATVHQVSNVTLAAGKTQITGRVSAGGVNPPVVELIQVGSGVAAGVTSTTHIPTGTTVTLYISGEYEISP